MQDGDCYHAAAHVPAGETEAQGDEPQLYSMSMGQVGAQICGLTANMSPTPNTPYPSTTPPSHPLAPLAGARAELRGAGLGPGGGRLPGA